MLAHTALYQSHSDLGAKLVPFAGFEMPLFYDLGMVKEHLWVRNSCGIFDVSHMGQFILKGKDAAKLCSNITPTDFFSANDNQAKYTVLANQNAGIIDDLIITKLAEEEFFIVLNASRREVDKKWIESFLKDYDCEFISLDKSLIAVQGPKAVEVLSNILGEQVQDQNYMNLQKFNYKSEEIYVSRTGYTGEDGFEVSISNEKAKDFWNELLENQNVKPIGLGARDSLRLEMGYPLYGNDLSEDINLAETSLKWIITSNENFLGKENILADIEKKRVGIKLIDKGVARDNMEIFDMNQKKIGVLTSAGFSPVLNSSIGQGYINIDNAKIGNQVLVKIREQFKKAEVSKISILPAKTKK